jgi:hypothetical protein
MKAERQRAGRLRGARVRCGQRVGVWMLGVLVAGSVAGQSGTLQFDVFLGYGGQPTGMGGVVREAGWFPVSCEVQNLGPTFDAVFELTPGQFGRGQTRRFEVELPTNTRKRFTIPVFASGGYYGTWDARLLDSDGRVRAEWAGMRPQAVAWETMILGALARTHGGAPRLPDLPDRETRSAQQPIAVRLSAELMPEEPIALEGLDALYLNSEKVLELRVAQGDAVARWVLGGGHLIVAVEDPAEVNAAVWLRDLVPARLGLVREMDATDATGAWGEPLVDPDTLGLRTRVGGVRLSQTKVFSKYDGSWLHGGASRVMGQGLESGLEAMEIPVVTSEPLEGEVLLSADGTPLVVRGRRGLGAVTLLTFSPEREPFRSWEGREWFWARLLGLPAEWYEADRAMMHGGQSVDGLLGMMIDSRQVRQLPVPWLLGLLVLYLLVIGPVDRYVLKRWRREMLTWVTFPAYVLLFSVSIYYIGYRLRAGETEWTELHVVDVVPRNGEPHWRGRTYASIYSPVNARYRVGTGSRQATLRGEHLGLAGGGQESAGIELTQRGDGFSAELYVPVWTSQLCVSDWVASGEAPIIAEWLETGQSKRLRVWNQLPAGITELVVVHGGRMYELGGLAAGVGDEYELNPRAGLALRSHVTAQGPAFARAIHQRHRAFGGDGTQWIEAGAGSLTAVTFLRELAQPGHGTQREQREYVYPAGLELSPVSRRGDAVLLAWVPDYAPVETIRQFKTVRSRADTFYRVTIAGGPDGRM